MSLAMSRIDYCNSVIFGLPASTLYLVHRVQNAASRLILGPSRPLHITPALQQLRLAQIRRCLSHCNPVRQTCILSVDHMSGLWNSLPP